MYKTHPNLARADPEKILKLNVMKLLLYIINDNISNLHNSLFDNDNTYMKVTLKSKLTGVARYVISADYRKF